MLAQSGLPVLKHTGHMRELELIQIRSLKIIFPELSYKEALIQSNRCTLKIQIMFQLL